MVRQSPFSTMVFDPAGRLLEVNRAFEEMWGVSAADVTAYNPFEDEQSHAQGMIPLLERAFAGEAVVMPEAPYDASQTVSRGHRRWIKTFAYPVKDDAGRVTEVVFMHEDVTARREAEEERARHGEAIGGERRRLRDIVGTVPGVVWEAWGEPDESSQRIDFVSGYVEQMLGYTVEEWLSTPNFWLTIVHPEDREAAARNSAEHFARGGAGVNRFRWVAKDGRVLHVESHSTVIAGEGGRPLGMRGVTLDVTDRKRAEEERERLLEREKALRAAAEEANRLKDEFLATVSHELRTPLTAILGWSQMLEDAGLDEGTARHAVTVIRRNAVQQQQIVDDILDVSRIITGKLRLETGPVELAQVAQSAMDMVRHAAEAKGIRLRAGLDPGAAVTGDPHRLQQVVWNLLANAVKFTPPGGEVRVGVSRLLTHVRVEVSDTGSGIAADFLPYVFDRFRQADSSTTRQHGGLGLGLSIVRHLVELHGGSVHVYSAGEGQGATFTVDLPPLPSEAPAAPEEGGAESGQETTHAARADAAGGEAPPPPLVGLRVLLVDDDEDSLEMLTAFLRRSGAEVAAVASAHEALEEMTVRAPDVIVSDIAMPGTDGYEFMRRVRASGAERGGRVPAVALTAYAGDSDRALALRAGYNLHLSKPVEPARLLEAVAELAAGPKSPHAGG
jgi:PAS domain S-box-containing protein